MAYVRDVRESRGIYTIEWDDGCTLRVRRKHFSKRPVQQGDTIEPEACESSLAALQAADAYEAALTLLDRSAKSKRRIVDALIRNGFVPAAAGAAAERLEEVGLINDAELAQRTAESMTHGSYGVYAARRRLMSRGISEEDSENALAVLDDRQQLEAAKRTAMKYRRRYESLPPREASRKLSQALARRGFTWDTITAALSAIGSEETDEYLE